MNEVHISPLFAALQDAKQSWLQSLDRQIKISLHLPLPDDPSGIAGEHELRILAEDYIVNRGLTFMQQYVTVQCPLGSWVENVNLTFASTHHAHLPTRSHGSSIDGLPFQLGQVPAEFHIAKVILLEFETVFFLAGNRLS